MSDKLPRFPWYGIPSSKTGSTCHVYMIQAGGLDLPKDLVLLPGSNKSNSPIGDGSKERDREMFFVPDMVFFIEHSATGHKYLFDLGMRKDLQNSTPAVVKNTLPNFKNYPESLVDILIEHGNEEQQPSTVKAVIFSHLHFDHVGNFGKSGFDKAELWVGPSTCTSARPGYPADKNSTVFSDDLPRDGSRKIVEFKLPYRLLDDKRRLAIKDAEENGNYEGINWDEPVGGWFGIGTFERALDLFNDGSAYIIDAPGHAAGHQMLLLRVKTGSIGVEDNFILLAGDCFHHPAMLGNPLLTARPPFSKFSMHSDPETAIDTMYRAKRCAEDDHIWVVGAHDFTIVDSVSPKTGPVKGLVLLSDWHANGWKHQ